jgi:hypothetical protein
MASTDYGDAGLRENIDVATHVQHQGWIVDFLEARRVRGIVERDDHCARRGCSCQLFLCQLKRLPRSHRLRRDGQQSGGLQFSERRPENCRDAAKMLHHPAGSTGAEPGGQSQSQPLHCLLARGSIGYGSQCRHGYLYLPVYVG